MLHNVGVALLFGLVLVGTACSGGGSDEVTAEDLVGIWMTDEPSYAQFITIQCGFCTQRQRINIREPSGIRSPSSRSAGRAGEFALRPFGERRDTLWLFGCRSLRSSPPCAHSQAEILLLG
jgi:hypothetical protein